MVLPINYILVTIITLECVRALILQKEYLYQYEGRVSTGLTTIRSQVAVSGFKCKLRLQVQKGSRVLAKLSEIEVGEYNGDGNCQLRCPMDILYQPLQYKAKQLKKTFVMHFDSKNVTLEVPSGDEEWLINIRKSVVQSFKSLPLESNFASFDSPPWLIVMKQGSVPAILEVEEDNMLGKCQSLYGFNFVNNSDHFHNEGSKYLNSSLHWKVIRSVNLDKCKDLVMLQHSPQMNLLSFGESQLKGVESRYLEEEFTLSGTAGEFQLEEALKEGGLVVNPFGFHDHTVDVFTNQTLKLISVKNTEATLEVDSLRLLSNWNFEVASPYMMLPGFSKPWINYYGIADKLNAIYPEFVVTGEKLSNEEIFKLQTDIESNLRQVSLSILDQNESDFSDSNSFDRSSTIDLLMRMTKVMRALPKDVIESIFRKIIGKRGPLPEMIETLLLDVTSASGTGPSIQVLLQYFGQNKISDNRIASILITMPNHVSSPAVISEIIMYVLSLPLDQKPFLTTIGVSSAAKLCKRFCREKSDQQLYGIFGCNLDHVQSFKRKLIQNFYSCQYPWQHLAWLEGIIQFGSADLMSFYRRILTYPGEISPMVRVATLRALLRGNMHHSAKDKATSLLLQVLENRCLSESIRRASLRVLLTWHPGAPVWHRIARCSWNEVSHSMQAFLYLFVKSVAESDSQSLGNQPEIASSALPLFRKSSYSRDPNDYNPFYHFNSHYQTNIDMETTFEAEYFNGLVNEFGTNLVQILGGVEVEFWKVLIQWFNGNQHHTSFSQMFGNSNWPQPQSPLASIFFNLFGGLQAMLPLAKDTMRATIGQGGSILLREMQKGIDFHLTKFFDPRPLEIFVPSAVGLPVLITFSSPMLFVNEGYVKIQDPDSSQLTFEDLWNTINVTIPYHNNHKFLSSTDSNAQIVLPWARASLTAGVMARKALIMPARGRLIQRIGPFGVHNITLDVIPHKKDKTNVLWASNVPFTSITNMIFEMKTDEDILPVMKRYDRKPSIKETYNFDPDLLGLNGSLSWEGDITPKPTFENIFGVLRDPQTLFSTFFSPSTTFWQTHLLLNMTCSPSKKLSFGFYAATVDAITIGDETTTSSNGSESMNIKNSTLEPSNNVVNSSDPVNQTGEQRNKTSTTENFYNLTQTEDRNVAEIFQAMEIYDALRFSSNDTYSRPMTTDDENFVSQTLFHPIVNARTRRIIVTTYVIGAYFMTQGDSPLHKTFLIEGHLSIDKRDTPIKTDLLGVGYRWGPFRKSEKKSYFKVACVGVDLASIRIPDLRSLELALAKGEKRLVRGYFWQEDTCYGETPYVFEGKFSVSADRKMKLLQEIRTTSFNKCLSDPLLPTINFPTATVFDTARIKMKLKESPPPYLLSPIRMFEEFVYGCVFPHVQFNYMVQNKPNVIKFQANRNYYTSGWSVRGQFPEKTVDLEGLWLPAPFDQMMTLKAAFPKEEIVDPFKQWVVLKEEAENSLRLKNIALGTASSYLSEKTPRLEFNGFSCRVEGLPLPPPQSTLFCCQGCHQLQPKILYACIQKNSSSDLPENSLSFINPKVQFYIDLPGYDINRLCRN